MNVAQATASAGLAAMVALLDSGSIDIYSGTMPATPETAATGTLLVTMTISATAGSTPAYTSPNMVSTLSFSAASFSPAANGTAGYARAWQSNGTTAVADLTVGTSGTDIVLGTTTISTGTTVTPSGTMSMPAV